MHNQSYFIFTLEQVAQIQIPVSLNQQKTKGSLTLKFVGEDGSSSETFNMAKRYVKKTLYKFYENLT